MKRISFLIILFNILVWGKVLVQGQIHHDSGSLLLIEPTGSEEEGLPVMCILPDSSTVSQKIKAAFDSSIVNEIIDLFFLAQNYAYDCGLVESIEPAYMAITSNQGGFAKKGFYLETDNGLVEKRSTPYIDITEDAATAPVERLMSFTQLYPHELGHVIYHLLSMEDTVSQNNRSVDMHYFSLVTDYPTAFNEGFAEHMENISRINESNKDIKSGIQEDLEAISALVSLSGPRFRKDLKNPLRLGYYKASMINWFQKYEDYKRYSHAIFGEVRYINTSPEFRNIEDRLTYRNAGLDWDTSAVRNVVQLHSTEGVISSFFTRLSMSSLGSHYQDNSFYAPFTNAARDSSVSWEELITPLQNMFIKYFYVFRNYMVDNNSDRSQLIDFIEGYIQSFPEEEPLLKEIYKEVTGSTYTNQLPPPLWILLKDRAHRMLTLDPYGGIEVPIYTFDLNAAEEEDLLTINGISAKDAKSILDFRKKHGLFQSLDDIGNVPGLDQEKAGLLISNAFEANAFEEILGDFDSDLTLSALVVKPVISILLRISTYFLLSYILLYLIVQRRTKTKPLTSRIYQIFRFYITWVFTSFLGLVLVVMMPDASFAFILYGIILMLLVFLIYRKHKTSLIYTSSMFLLMLLLVWFSII